MNIYTATLEKNGLLVTKNIGAKNKRKAINALLHDNNDILLNIIKIASIR